VSNAAVHPTAEALRRAEDVQRPDVPLLTPQQLLESQEIDRTPTPDGGPSQGPGQRFRESLTVLRHPEFRLVLIERLLSTSATGISTVALSFAVLAVADATSLSYVLAAQLAPMLVFTLVGGILADRIRPQVVMMAANICAAVGEGLAGVLMLTHSASTWSLLIAALLTGTGGALFYPASSALTPRLVAPEQMQAASSLSRLAQSSMLMLGSALGGVLVTAFGPGWAMSLDAVILLVGTVPLLGITVPALARDAGHAPNMVHELREGWTEVRTRTWLWAVILCYAIVLAGWFGGFMLTGPVVAKEHLGGAGAWAIIISADGLGVVLGGILGLVHQARRPMLTGTILTFAFTLPPLVMGLGGGTWVIAAAALAAGLAGEYFMILWMVTLSRQIPQDKLARVYSYDALGSLSASPVGYLVAGPLVTAAGTKAVQVGAAVLIAGATGATLLSRDVRTMRIDDEPAAGAAVGPVAVAEGQHRA
jgi:predicted MFS family arabinose efflux permease